LYVEPPGKELSDQVKADGSTAPRSVLLKKLVSNNPHPDSRFSIFLISGIAFDLRGGPVRQCTWVQGASVIYMKD
jgi:hypothetical protein